MAKLTLGELRAKYPPPTGRIPSRHPGPNQPAQSVVPTPASSGRKG